MKVISNIYATPTGFKTGAKGKVIPKGVFLASLPKSERRKIRKACFKAGFLAHAAA